MRPVQILIILIVQCIIATASKYNFGDLIIQNVDRIVSLQGKCPDVVISLKVQNIGKTAANKFYYAVSNDLKNNAVTILLEGRDKKEYLGSYVEDLSFQASNNASLIEFTLDQPISPQQTATLKIKELYIKRWVPYPTAIDLTERQLVKFFDNKFFLSPYTVTKQKTLYHTNGIESFSDDSQLVKQVNSVVFETSDSRAPFSKDTIYIHLLNNNAFPILSKSEKTIQVSHWGNIAIEYFNKLYNDGAALKGEFGRVTYNKYNPVNGKNAIKQLYAEIPYHAWGAFYYDEIGNISTSHAWRDSTTSSVKFQIEPRFPILGKWKSNFYLGYNLPPQMYLFQNSTSGKFVLKQQFYIDIHDLVTEQYTLKVILPEGAYDISYDLPFDVEEKSQEQTFSYLDTEGRPTLVFKKSLVTQFHNQQFQVYYRLEQNTQWKKAFLLFSVFFTLFIVLITINRLELQSFKGEVTPQPTQAKQAK